MTGRLAVLVSVLALARCFAEVADEVRHLDLPEAPGVTAAGFDYVEDVPVRECRGVVVLVPGCNGNGADMLREAAWRDFARTNRFVLGAFTFQSDVADLENEGGYYDTAQGSGELAVSALKALGNGRKLPVVMYGFSGGAHFTASFADRHPDWLKGWCAASFSLKTRGPALDASLGAGRAPPGIVACGQNDRRWGRAMSYFCRGRELDRKWTWVEVPDIDHQRDPRLEDFARAYFAAVLSPSRESGVWADLGSGEVLEHPAEISKAARTWLPSRALHAPWLALTRKRTVKVFAHRVTLKNDAKPLTLFLRKPLSGAAPKGVLCLCLLADSADEVRALLERGTDGLYRYAEERDFAIVAWGSRGLWDANYNWDELSREKLRATDAAFDAMAAGWDEGVAHFVKEHGIPASGYLMSGGCGAGQFVQRLALRRPERFLAVHMHIPGSFDKPTRKGGGVLWCLTTGERLEGGYDRSLRFFLSIRAQYPIVYKAYPGVSHTDSSPARSGALGRACFDFALREYARATQAHGGKPTTPDWEEIFASSPLVADIKNQTVHPVADYLCVANEYRMLLPAELRADWLRE